MQTGTAHSIRAAIRCIYQKSYVNTNNTIADVECEGCTLVVLAETLLETIERPYVPGRNLVVKDPMIDQFTITVTPVPPSLDNERERGKMARE